MRKKLPVLYALSILFFTLTLYKVAVPTHSSSIDSQFETFTETLFCQELSSNTLNLHYTLKHPENYPLIDETVTLGKYQTDSVNACAALENCLAVLDSFPYEQLSPKNQLTYDILNTYLEDSIALAPYTLYEEPLSPLTGTQAQLPILLSEYAFYEENDVITYLSLLETFPAYFQSLIEFEQAKAHAGLFMSESLAQDVIDECKTFLALQDSHYLYTSFEHRINQLSDLSESKIKSYVEQNINSIETFIFPSYQKLINALSELKSKGVNSNGLCHFPDGKSYYKYLIRQQTGSSRTIEELQALTFQYITEDLSSIQSFLSSSELKSSSFLLESDPDKILFSLKNKMKTAFPEPVPVDISVKYVQDEMADYLSPAFYLIPPIDNLGANTIYLNSTHLPDQLDLFTTLAHEGYPGHLYQTTYFGAQNPDPIRSILNFGGYTEGWATYAEHISYYFSELPKEQAALHQHNTSLLLGIYALADMGIHNDGWTLADTISFFHDYGITNNDTISQIYNRILGDPGNYLKYYIGYIEFLELKKYVIQEWNEKFKEKTFHKAVLDIGPAPFDIIKKWLEKGYPNLSPTIHSLQALPVSQ